MKAAASSSIPHAVAGIRSWGEARDWRGHDPYDALNSPIAGLLPSRIGRRLLTQAVKLSPLNLRPLLRIEPAWNQKAIGLVASGYARLGLEAEADRWLGWLAESHVGDGGATAWGYHFPVETRFFAYARNTPNTIATSFVAHAFLDAHEYFGDRRSADVARATATYLERHMLAQGTGGPFFRYLPGEDAVIHNANVLACAVLARTARLVGEHAWLEPARSALQTTLAAQRNDGSWPYAVGAHGWVDNFHTGYVLESLAHFPEARAQLERGLRYWERAFFLADGTPKFFAERIFPIDAHCYAQAIETWLAVGDLERAERAAELLIRRMVDPSGYVYFQQQRFWTNKVPLIRWTTAPSFRALAGILRARGDQRSES